MPRFVTARGIVFGLALAFFVAAAGPDLRAEGDEVTKLDDQAFDLYDHGQKQEGVAVAEQALALAERLYGPDSPRVADQANDLGLLYKAEGRNAEAQKLYERSIAIGEKTSGPDSAELIPTLRNFALLYSDQGRKAEAEPLYLRAIAINDKSGDRNLSNLANCLDELGNIYSDEGRNGEAEPLIKRAIAVREQSSGPDDPALTRPLDNLALLYTYLGRYPEAEALATRSLRIGEKAHGPDDLKIAGTLNTLGIIYRNQGRLSEAESIYKRTISIEEKARGHDNEMVATVLTNLATVHEQQGHYAEAEPLYTDAIQIFEKIMGPDAPNIVLPLRNLAYVYDDEGRFGEAEIALKRSLAIQEKALGPDYVEIAKTIGALGGLYVEQGRNAEAETLMKRAVAVAEKALGPDHPDVSSYLINLGIFYSKIDRYEEADALLKRGLAIREKVFGRDHAQTAEALTDLSTNELLAGKLKEAEPLLKRALKTAEKKLGPEHPAVATAFNNLGQLYMRAGRYREAERAYHRALTIIAKTLGPDHPYMAATFQNLASSYVLQGDWRHAVETITLSTETILRRIRRGSEVVGRALTGTSEDEIADNRFAFEFLVKTLYRLAFDVPQRAVEITEKSFWAAQWISGSEAASSLAQMSARQARGDARLAQLIRERQDLVAEWHSGDKTLSGDASASPESRNPDAERQLRSRLTAIDERIAAIDRTLAQDFPDYAMLAKPEPLSVQDVQRQLRPNEVLLFYVDTGELAPAPAQTFVWIVTPGDARLAALYIRPKDIAAKVSKLRELLGVGGGVRAARVIGEDDSEKAFDLDVAHELYGDLLGLVEEYATSKTLIVVPSKSMTSLPFQLLVSQAPDAQLRGTEAYGQARWLIRDHAITVLPSVASLKALRQAAKASAASRPYLGIGDPLITGGNDQDRRAWNAQSCPQGEKPVLVAAAEGVGNHDVSTFFRGGLADVAEVRGLMPLPETASELCAVAQSLGGGADSVVLGAQATETNLKKMSADGELARARVVHFATHGLVAGDLKGLAEPSLVLTPPDQPSEADDGLLTASEVTSLKLDADWVILSACNTAAGENGNAEALSGLARAFFYAGARALLVSHWPVNSKAAVELTTRTLGMLAKEPAIGRAEALRRAMLSLIDEGGEKAQPAYWAPFVLVGDSG